MSDLLSSLHQTIENLFLVGDSIPCQNQKEGFRITAIHEGWIALAHANNDLENIRLELSSLAAALENGESATQPQESPWLGCFVSEYRLRQEQARREAEVDEMWRTAMSCQL